MTETAYADEVDREQRRLMRLLSADDLFDALDDDRIDEVIAAIKTGETARVGEMVTRIVNEWATRVAERGIDPLDDDPTEPVDFDDDTPDF